MIRVVIVDDHPLVRAGMRTVLNATDDIMVVAEGTCGKDALRLVAAHQPDVLVLDVNLPDVTGIEVTRQLCAQHTRASILILTVHNDAETIFGLLEAGAAGYVLKDDALETLASAIHAIYRGESWLSPAVARQVVQRARNIHPSSNDSPPLDITPRENEVLCLLAQGLDNTAIAKQLVITTRTVQNHVSTIYAKLGVTTRTEAALIALRHGLVQIAPDKK
jgi:DNA-binding NarL/FixJ family response regulator